MRRSNSFLRAGFGLCLAASLQACVPEVASEAAYNPLFGEPDTTGYSQWLMVSRSMQHTIGIRTDGTMWAWGANNAGQLGLGNTAPHAAPFQVGTDNTWTYVAVGNCCSLPASTVALKLDGTVWTWGGNANGDLGQGASDTGPHSTPLQVAALGGVIVTSVDTGGASAIAKESGGTVYTWGRGNVGQLGQAATNPSCSGTSLECTVQPTAVSFLAGATRLALSDFTGFARMPDNSLVGWGFNNHGSIGNGSVGVQAIVGTNLPGGRLVAKVSASEHTLAIATDGTLWSSGYNAYGQLGRDASLADDYSWGQVGTGTNWKDVAALGYHSLALKTNGTLWSWGDNSNGELGWTPPTTYCSGNCWPFPQQVGIASNWAKLINGGAYLQSGALKDNGVLFAWGLNDVGQHGDGTVGGSFNVPTPVP